MSDLFISYSRRDTSFVRHLTQVLDEHGYSAWVDWQNIPPATTFLAEIYAGIEESGVFAFVLSPDSIVSDTCVKEMQYALKHHKKIIPLLCHQVAIQMVPEPLRELQWISFTENELFDNAFKLFLLALETDLDYWRQGAVWHSRAVLWSNKKQDRSILLHGTELKEAEAWLRTGTEKKPRPTQQQIDFISLSRRIDRRRTISNRIVSAFTIFLLLVLISGGTWQVTHLPPDPRQVHNLNDAGPGSLRQAIALSPNDSIITFDPQLHGKIILTSANLVTSKHLKIVGPGARLLAISSDLGGYDIEFIAGASIAITGLSFKDSIVRQTGRSFLTFIKSTVTLTNCIISGNKVIDNQSGGGGINMYYSNLTLINSIVSENAAKESGHFGGGISKEGGKLFLLNTTISDNSAIENVDNSGASGGGISNYGGEVMSLNSTISGNVADILGGGVYSESGKLTFMNTTIADNEVYGDNRGGWGGGIYNGYSQIELTFCTVVGNKAPIGPGVSYVPVTISGFPPLTKQGFTLRNTLVAHNQARSKNAPDLEGQILYEAGKYKIGPIFLSRGYNLIEHMNDAFFIPTKDHVTDRSADPRLDAQLRDNGGQQQPHTQTYALLPGSPAAAVIPPATCHPNNILTDQRGTPRPQKSNCSIGAYQY